MRRLEAGVATAVVLISAVLPLSCGGESEGIGRKSGVPDGFRAAQPDAGPSSAPTPSSPQPPPQAAPAPTENLEIFDDPGCPDVPAYVEDRTCDPFGSTDQCDFGWACFPYVAYPSTQCEPERFGTRCEPAGDGTQGAPCEDSPCAPGYLCIASGQGTVCAQLCELPGQSVCAAGLICGSVDIKGYGVCF